MLLKLEHIYKDYVQDKLTVPVLKDICFQVERGEYVAIMGCLLYTSPSPRDGLLSRMPSSA